MNVEEQRRLRSRARTQRHRDRSSDVRALRTCLVDLHTCSSGCSLPSARGLICACVYLVYFLILILLSFCPILSVAIFMCVCVCVCVCWGGGARNKANDYLCNYYMDVLGNVCMLLHSPMLKVVLWPVSDHPLMVCMGIHQN